MFLDTSSISQVASLNMLAQRHDIYANQKTVFNRLKWDRLLCEKRPAKLQILIPLMFWQFTKSCKEDMVTQVCKPSPWESEVGDSSGDRLTKKEKKNTKI